MQVSGTSWFVYPAAAFVITDLVGPAYLAAPIILPFAMNLCILMRGALPKGGKNKRRVLTALPQPEEAPSGGVHRQKNSEDIVPLFTSSAIGATQIRRSQGDLLRADQEKSEDWKATLIDATGVALFTLAMLAIPLEGSLGRVISLSWLLGISLLASARTLFMVFGHKNESFSPSSTASGGNGDGLHEEEDSGHTLCCGAAEHTLNMLRLFLAILTTVTVSASLPFNVQHEGQNGASAAGIAVGACLVFIHTLFVLACCFCACSPRFTLASPAAKAKPFSRKVSKTGLDIFVGDKIRNVRRQSRISAI